MSRDSGTVRHHRRYVALDVPVNVRPARWPTVAGLSWAAAALTAVLALGGMVLARARPRRVHLPAAGPARLRLDGVRAAGPAARSSDGPAALPDRAGGRVRHGALHVRAVRPGALARFAAVLDRGAVDQQLGLRARHQPGRHGPAAGLPGGQAAVAAVPARAVGGAGVHPAGHRRFRLLPAGPGPAVPPPAQPVRHPPARLALRDVRGPGHRVRCRRRRRARRRA